LGFKRQVAFTYLVRIALIPVGLVVTVVLARGLGPAGLGLFAAISAIIGTTAQLGNLGLPVSVSRYGARDALQVPALIANARLLGAGTGLLAVSVLFAIDRLFPALFGTVPLDLLMIAAFALPLSFASAQFQAILLGRQMIRRYNAAEVLDRLLLLVAAVVVLLVIGGGLRELILATLAVAVVQYLLFQLMLWPDSRRLRPDPGLLRRMAGFSGRVYVVTLLSYLVLRSDVLLINALRGAADTGLYAVAVRPVDFLLALPAVAGTLLFPRIAASEDRASAGFTAKVARHVSLVMGLACVGLAAVAWWIVPLLFGAAYRDSVLPLWILLPGVWCIAVESILANDLAGRDYPKILIWIWTVLLGTNVALNILWIPRHGISGAAGASLVTYALSLVLVGRYWTRRFPEIPVADLFVLHADEWRDLFGRLIRRDRLEDSVTASPRADGSL
jgi:O-antigen/teichoic acid export membrane protein